MAEPPTLDERKRMHVIYSARIRCEHGHEQDFAAALYREHIPDTEEVYSAEILALRNKALDKAREVHGEVTRQSWSTAPIVVEIPAAA